MPRTLHRGTTRVSEPESALSVPEPAIDPAQVAQLSCPPDAELGDIVANTESAYRAFLEQLPVITYLSHPEENGRTLFVSPQVEAMLGYSVADWLSGRVMWLELIHPEDRERTWAEFARNQPGKERFSVEYRLLSKDGRFVWFRDDATLIKDAAGKPLYVQGVLSDISERKGAEDALRRSEELFYNAFMNASIGMALAAVGGKHLQVNPALCRMLGYTESELLATDWKSITHPDDIDTDLRLSQPMYEGEYNSFQVQKRFLHKDGHAVWGLLDVSLVRGEDGTPLYTIGQLQDFTGHKLSAQRIKFDSELLDQVSTAVVAIDLAGRITHWNKYAEKLYGWRKEEVLGAPIGAVTVAPEDIEISMEILEQVRITGSWEGEFTVRRKDGTRFPAHVVNTLIRDESGEAVGIVGLSNDITERKNYERALQENAAYQSHLLHALMSAQEAERRRLSMDLHDGPLQSLGVSLMALDRSLRRRERGEHDLADEELRHLRQTLTDTVGEVRAVLADLSLDILTSYGLESALEGHVTRFTELTGIRTQLESNLHRRLPSDVELLVYRLSQEALANVRKHSQAEHAWVALAVEKNNLCLTIVDDGTGFDVEAALKQIDDGKKLGLKSMRQRVRAAGGDLEIESEPGKGSTLVFRCPIPDINTRPLS